eukprot:13218371-Alexandrium_andersonii.AAC.1
MFQVLLGQPEHEAALPLGRSCKPPGAVCAWTCVPCKRPPSPREVSTVPIMQSIVPKRSESRGSGAIGQETFKQQ